MAAALTPYAQPEPFEEMTVAGQRPPDELEEYYKQLERVELERRASKKSRWSRKSFRGVDMHIEELVRARELRVQREREERDRGTPNESRVPTPEPAPGPPTHWNEQQQQQPSQQQQQQPQRSWASPTSAASPIYKKYDIFNPAGPKFYMNHHLNPKVEARAPSVFSPNFPAFPSTPEVMPATDKLGTKSTPEHHRLSPDNERFPQSSNGKLRRKSPSDSPVDDPRNNAVTRSATAPYGQSRMTPSPLSQSVTTLPASDQHLKEPPRVTRKLSKRNSQVKGRGLFGRSGTSDTEEMTTRVNASTASLATTQSRPRPMSIAIPPTQVQPPTKRMSVLGKLAKKLSFARHTPPTMTVERRPPPSPNSTPANTPPAPTPASAQSARPPFGAVPSAENVSAYASGQGHAWDGDGYQTQQDGERRTPSPAKADRDRRRPNSSLDDPPPTLELSLQHNGALVTSPPPSLEASSKPLYSTSSSSQMTSEAPDAAPSEEGRDSPDPQFHIGNLMITNPDEYANTEPSSTPRVPPAQLAPAPAPMPRFNVASMYSDTGATANSSSGSLPLLHVINPSAPTPDPQEQLEALRRLQEREAPPPMPPPRQSSPQKQPAGRSDSQLVATSSRPAASRSDLELRSSSTHTTSQTDLHQANHPPTRRSESEKSERRISRKPPPSVLPAQEGVLSSTRPSSSSRPSLQTNGSARSGPSPDPTTLAMAKYVEEQAKAREEERNLITGVDGEEWEVVPVKERERQRERERERERDRDRDREPERKRLSKLQRSSSKKPEREPSSHRQRTMSKPERSTVQREASHTSSRAPSPPPKSVHRYRLERKISTDTPSRSSPAPESPTKGGDRSPTKARETSPTKRGDRSPTKASTSDRNKPTPPPPPPNKLSPASPRPVSEVFDNEYEQHLRAREAFDAERMRKGMSFVGSGRDAELPAPPVPSRDPSYETPVAPQRSPQRMKSLGSGHTAFVMTPPIVGPPRPGAF